MKKISLETIKKLREKTGAGVMEVKRALEEANGEEKKAMEIIKKQGLVKAEKRADKNTSEGVVGSYVHQGGRIASLVEVNCETDFVARTPEFEKLVRELAMQVVSMDPRDVKTLLAQGYIRDPKKTVKELVLEVVGKTGEKIEVKRFVRFELGQK